MPEPQADLSSLRNPTLKDLRRAVMRGTLTEDGSAIAEGFHLLEEALRSESEITAILAAKSVRSTVEGLVRGLKHRVTAVDDSVFSVISSTESTQGVVTLVRPRTWKVEQLFRGRSIVAVLDGVQDPGNAGTIVRTAEAFGATGVIFVKGTVSPHNPKALRASAGSLFRIPYVTGLDPALTRAALQQKRITLYAAHPRGQKPLPEADLRSPFAIVIGSEGRGVSQELESAALDLKIPTIRVESLNAAMAAGIVLYEASRQRIVK
ncbi:MAG: RNA methyltransferase [Acidobacteria bacterium]|nr:RNA methyltransferase [Acidobacteriota bacterium]